MSAFPHVVILSGGAETVSIALAAALNRLERAYSVLSLNPTSLLEGAAGCVHYESVWSEGQSFDGTRQSLIERLTLLGAGQSAPVLVFPTEDDGLSLLNSARDALAKIARFSRGRALDSGGLDKNELFRVLKKKSLDILIPQSVELRAPEELPKILNALAGMAIIKPAHKPWKKTIDSIGSKVFDSQAHLDPSGDPSRLMEVLRTHWSLSSAWIVQEKLYPFEDGERSACVVRNHSFEGIQVVEQLKFPRHGGSAVVVKSSLDRDLMPIAERIAEAIDLQGMAEMSFLQDHSGRPRLIELNTRPWLQIELVEASGFPIVEKTLQALIEEPTLSRKHTIKARQWVHLELLLRGWAYGDFGHRLKAIWQVLCLFERWPILAVYSTKLPGIRWRWLKRNAIKLLRKV